MGNRKFSGRNEILQNDLPRTAAHSSKFLLEELGTVLDGIWRSQTYLSKILSEKVFNFTRESRVFTIKKLISFRCEIRQKWYKWCSKIVGTRQVHNTRNFRGTRKSKKEVDEDVSPGNDGKDLTAVINLNLKKQTEAGSLKFYMFNCNTKFK